MNRISALPLRLIVLVIPLLSLVSLPGKTLPLNNALVSEIPFPEGDLGEFAWNITWDENGVAYVGRDQLWRWDGTEWTVHGPNSLSELRGMHFGPDKRLWLGGVNSIGYFHPETLQYVSVLDWLPEEHRILGEVWEVHHDGQFLWVGTSHKLFRLSPDSFKLWEFSSDHRVVFHFVGDDVFAHVPMKAFFQIQTNGQNILFDVSALGENAIMMLRENSPKMLSGVFGGGYFEINKIERKISRIVPHKMDGLSAVDYSDSIGFVCGTLRSEIFFFDILGFTNAGDRLRSSLDNSSVIKVVFESEKELWILSTSGVFKVCFGIPIQHIEKMGTGISSSTRSPNGKIYFGTSDGAFSVDLLSNDIEEIQSVEVRKIQQLGEGIFLNNYDGIVCSKDEEMSVVFSGVGEIWNFHITKSGYMYASYQDRIVTYRKEKEGAWALVSEHDVAGPFSVLDEDEMGTIWGGVDGGPMYALRIEDDGGGVMIERHRTLLDKSLTRDKYRMEMTERGPVLIFEDLLVRWDPVAQAWESGMLPLMPSPPLGQAFTLDSGALEGWITYPGSGGGGPVLAHVEWGETSSPDFRLVPWVDMSSLGKIHKMKYLDGEDVRLAFMGMNGLMLVDPGLSENLPLPRKPVIWDAFTDRKAGPEVEVNYGDSGLRFKYSSPGTGLYYPVRYQSRIRGLEMNWSEVSNFTDREIGQLFEGDYEFEVVAVDPIGRRSEVSSVRLTVHPPWHRTPFAYGAWIVLILLMGYGLLRYLLNRARNRQVELELLVDDRTRELRQANLYKDEFIANMSHEIRNPLNGVIGLIGQLREGESPSRRNLLALRGAARYLRTTVEAVLDFSKLESGTVTLQDTEFDLMDIADGVLRIYKDHADDKGLELVSRLSFSNGVRICADERKFQQILGNLTSNAVKFTDEGSVLVELSLSGSSGVCTLNIVVKDTGCGIPESQQQRVFEKFQQCKSGGLKPSGTGLGLTLVRSFVDTMAGTLTMDSIVGLGTTIEVCLPVEVIPEEESSDKKGVVIESQRKLSVLIVEDLEYNRAYLEDFLTSRGCHVTSAGDGIEGFNLAMRGGFDLILLDWELPGMNGLEIAQQLRKGNFAGDHVRIVGMTAFATFKVREQCLEGGMNTFLTKPIDPSLLTAELAVAGMLNRPSEEQEGEGLDDVPSEGFILHAGILGEMTCEDEWPAQKERWLGIFESHMDSVSVSLENDDLSSLGKSAHKLLGHLRMLKIRELPEAVIDLLTAVHAEDLPGAKVEWARFKSLLPQFLDEFDSLGIK